MAEIALVLYLLIWLKRKKIVKLPDIVFMDMFIEALYVFCLRWNIYHINVLII